MPPALLELDSAASRFLQVQAHVPLLNSIFGITSSLLDLVGLVALVVLVGLRLAGRHVPRLAVLVNAFLLAALLTLVAKGLTERENVRLYNPFPSDPISRYVNPVPVIAGMLLIAGADAEGVRSFLSEPTRAFLRRALFTSFPSGHAARAAALATSAALLWPAWRWSLTLAAAWVAFSRAYIGAHWPFDVLVGVLLGLFCGWLAYRLAGGKRGAQGTTRRASYKA